MTTTQITNIFVSNNLPKPKVIQKIDVGFTNLVYSIDDTYILKICKKSDNERDFEREVALYSLFKTKLPVPEVLVYDKSKNLADSHYIVYPKIKGDNLYNVWHELTNEKRRLYIKQLCAMLRTINQVGLNEIPANANLNVNKNWKDILLESILNQLKSIEGSATLNKNQVLSIRNYVNEHIHILDEQKLALVYWDAHFDNILVSHDKIVGLLDFERTVIASIDYVIDIVKRMVDQPKKYMSVYAEQFARDEDYAKLLDWYKEFYSELFDFDDMATRLNLYTIEHNLKALKYWPEVVELKEEIEAIVSP